MHKSVRMRTRLLAAQQGLHEVVHRRRGAVGEPEVVDVAGVAVASLDAL